MKSASKRLFRHSLSLTIQFLILCLWCCSILRGQQSDSLTLTFRFTAAPGQYVRLFLPGDFNNWGPTSAGMIAPDAPSLMAYDSTLSCWIKKVRLHVAETHYYKFHYHLNQSGTSYQWTADSLNPLLDGTTYGNSAISIFDPMIFEPQRIISAPDSVSGIRAAVGSTHGVRLATLQLGSETLQVQSSFDPALGLLNVTLPHRIPIDQQITLRITDSLGAVVNYAFVDTFPPIPPPPTATVPSWAADALWYQIFPERFRNGDNANNPTWISLEAPNYVPITWRISPWTGDWYARDTWETQKGPGFYDAVFDRRYGGDLQGVIDKLGYLDSLGVNALYFNPVFYARSLHKYDGSAHHHIDPFFGPHPSHDLSVMATETPDSTTWHWTSADSLFLKLIQLAHARGMHVIIDGVFNHTGRSFYAFNDLLTRQQASPYKDWYIVYSFDNPSTPQDEFRYKGWYGYGALPEFADRADGLTVADGPRRYIFTITRRWMDPNGDGDPSDGVDGWRLDTVPDVPIGFWAEWNGLVRSINPDAYTVSEVWSDASATIRDGGFSATMNYNGCAFPIYDFLIRNATPASDMYNRIAGNIATYGASVALANQNLIDSHDTERLMSMIVNAGQSTGYQTFRSPNGNPSYEIRKPNARERKIQELVLLAQTTMIGAPMIYYGDEAGMWGASDPDDRMPMVWPDLTFDPQSHDPRGYSRTPDIVGFDAAVTGTYSSFLSLRKQHQALRRGSIALLAVDDSNSLLSFSRTAAGDTLIVIMNRSLNPRSLTIPLATLPHGPSHQYGVLLSTGNSIAGIGIAANGSSLTVSLPALTGAVLKDNIPAVASILLNKGWNLISLPVDPYDRSVHALIPSAVSPLYAYTGSAYQTDTMLEAGRGYWLKGGSAQAFPLQGIPFTADTIAVQAGWNLIGSISAPVPAGAITSAPPGITTSQFFGYAGGYIETDTLLPGIGYWVKADQAGSLILSSSLQAGARACIRIVRTASLPPPPPAGTATREQIPATYALLQNYPNPFNPSTTIDYALPVRSHVSLTLFNALGQITEILAEGYQDAGRWSVRWNGERCSSGIYWYRIDAVPVTEPSKVFTSTRKMILIK